MLMAKKIFFNKSEEPASRKYMMRFKGRKGTMQSHVRPSAIKSAWPNAWNTLNSNTEYGLFTTKQRNQDWCDLLNWNLF